EATEKMLTEAKTNNLDILAPKNYERAEESLSDARKALTKGKTKEKVLENIAEARGWLAEAQARGDVTRAAAKGLPDARSGAIQANAPAVFPKEFKKLEKETRDLTEDAEKGDVKKIAQRSDSLTQSYLKLETDAVTRNSLGEAQLNLEAARKEGAAKTSPKTLAATEASINSALSLIKENPRNTSAIKRAADEATEQSKFLLQVNQKTKAGNTEDLVLQSEKQKRQISGLSSQYAQTESKLSTKEAELKKKEAALSTAEELRRQLKPTEAEVFVENETVKVRLKGLQFASNKATLSKKNTALLEKVDKALGTVGASSIVVEGHTDSVGSAESNREISEKRAQAVQNYLVQKGQIASDKVKAVGLGEEGAISDNKTSRGRSENRRIDLVIEPRIE
ncbi:MAG: OmpA family protein, partial [Pseudobdellovibrionaceae bacterium]